MTSIRGELIKRGIIKPAGMRRAPEPRTVVCPHCRRVLANDEQYAQHLREVHAL